MCQHNIPKSADGHIESKKIVNKQKTVLFIIDLISKNWLNFLAI